MILAAAFVIAKIYRQICTIIFLNLLNKGHYARIRMFYVRIGKYGGRGMIVITPKRIKGTGQEISVKQD